MRRLDISDNGESEVAHAGKESVSVRPQSNDGAEATPVGALGLAALLAGAFVVVLDFFIVIVALPSIKINLNASDGALQLVVAAYGAANAAALIAGGKLGDVFGRRRLFMVGTGLFGLTSIWCACATSGASLVLGRVCQGLAGAMLQPQVLALLNVNFQGRARQRAFAAYGVSMGIAGVCGQMLGGWMIEMNLLALSWRWCFLINVPVCAAAMLGARLLLKETGRAKGMGEIDFMGMVLVAACMSMFVVAMSNGLTGTATRMGLGAGALVLLCVLWAQQKGREARGLNAMLSRRLFTNARFRTGAVTVLVFYCGVASFYFVLGMHLQTALGMSPAAAGQMFVYLGAAFMSASLAGPRIQSRLGENALTVGATILLVGHIVQLAAASVGAGTVAAIGALLIEGCGIGIVMAPLMAAASRSVEQGQAGVAAGVLATMQSAGNATGVASLSMLYFTLEEAERSSAGSYGFVGSMACLCVAAVLLIVMTRRMRAE